MARRLRWRAEQSTHQDGGFWDDGRLRFYTIRDLTLWDTEAAGGTKR